MPITALILVLVAAVVHAYWNFVAKKVTEKQIVTWWAIIVGSGLSLPFVLPRVAIPLTIWPYGVGSALAEAIYYFLLIRAYEHSDFSLTYPIARGVAPALITIGSIIFAGESPKPAGIAGILIVLIGLVVVGAGHTFIHRINKSVNMKGIWLALLVAVMISIYSIIDATVVRAVAAFPYLMIVLTLTGVFMAPVLMVRYGCRAVFAPWRAYFRQIILIAVLMPLAYVLVLQAYAVAPISYVGAIREVSIVLAAFAGWRWLGEDLGKIRIFGAVLIFLGILVITLAG